MVWGEAVPSWTQYMFPPWSFEQVQLTGPEVPELPLLVMPHVVAQEPPMLDWLSVSQLEGPPLELSMKLMIDALSMHWIATSELLPTRDLRVQRLQVSLPLLGPLLYEE